MAGDLSYFFMEHHRVIVYGAPSVWRMVVETIWGFPFFCAHGIRPLLNLKVQLIQDHNYGERFVPELTQVAFKSFSLQCCNFYLEVVPWVAWQSIPAVSRHFIPWCCIILTSCCMRSSILMLHFSPWMRFSTLITFFRGEFKLISLKCS